MDLTRLKIDAITGEDIIRRNNSVTFLSARYRNAGDIVPHECILKVPSREYDLHTKFSHTIKGSQIRILEINEGVVMPVLIGSLGPAY